MDKNHAVCLSDRCRQLTGHKSGYCEKCRTAQCPKCKKVYMSSRGKPGTRDICSSCRKYKKVGSDWIV